MRSPSTLSCRSLSPAIKQIILDEATILKRVKELGCEISHDYRRKELVVVGILKGAFVFTCDLVRNLAFPLSPDFIAVSHYEGRPRSGEVRIVLDLQEDIHHKHVLLVEDIVDTGFTLNYLVRLLLQRDPASLAICTLLDRPELRLVDIPLKYVGFDVNHEFLIGYGLDYREYYRDLPFVATIDPEQLTADN